MRFIEIIENNTEKRTLINLDTIEFLHLLTNPNNQDNFMIRIWSAGKFTDIQGENAKNIYDEIISILKTSAHIKQLELNVNF